MPAESSSSWTFPDSELLGLFFLLIHTKTSQFQIKAVETDLEVTLVTEDYRGQCLEHQRRVKKELEQQDDMNIVPEVFMISVGGVGSFFF